MRLGELDGIDAQALRQCFGLLDEAKRRSGLALHMLAPGAQILGGDRLGRECRIICGRGQRHMQLRGALGERVHQREIGAVDVLGERAARPAIFEESHQIVGGVFPSVALVHHKGLQERERVEVTVVASALHRAADRHDVREMRHFGEEAPDLHFRIEARLQLAIELQEQLVAHAQGGVRALGHLCAKREVRARFGAQALVRLCAGKDELATLGAIFATEPDRLDQRAAEVLVEGCIRQHADLRLLAHARNGVGLQFREPAVIAVFVHDGERQ